MNYKNFAFSTQPPSTEPLLHVHLLTVQYQAFTNLEVSSFTPASKNTPSSIPVQVVQVVLLPLRSPAFIKYYFTT